MIISLELPNAGDKLKELKGITLVFENEEKNQIITHCSKSEIECGEKAASVYLLEFVDSTVSTPQGLLPISASKLTFNYFQGYKLKRVLVNEMVLSYDDVALHKYGVGEAVVMFPPYDVKTADAMIFNYTDCVLYFTVSNVTSLASKPVNKDVFDLLD